MAEKRRGARVEVVPTDGVSLDTETFLAAIDDTTLIVPISHDYAMPEQDYADSAWRMLGGTPAIAALYQSRAGQDIVAEIGAKAIREKAVRLCRRAIEQRDLAGGWRRRELGEIPGRDAVKIAVCSNAFWVRRACACRHCAWGR